MLALGLVLTLPLAGADASGTMGLAWVVAIGIALFALPVTACVALVGRDRCRECGARFTVGSDGPEQKLLPFPWPLYITGIVLMALLCLVGPRLLQAYFGDPHPGLSDEVNWLVLFGLGLWGALAFQVVAFHLLRETRANAAVWSLAFLTPVVAVGALALYGSVPRVRAARILARTNLAPLPDSAEQIRVYTGWSADQADGYVRFHAEADVIEQFLSESSALNAVSPEEFDERGAGLDPLHPMFEIGLSWYTTHDIARGRRYLKVHEAGVETLAVTVDDNKQMIYIGARWRAYPKDK
jgi:hypothetical protein